MLSCQAQLCPAVRLPSGHAVPFTPQHSRSALELEQPSPPFRQTCAQNVLRGSLVERCSGCQCSGLARHRRTTTPPGMGQVGLYLDLRCAPTGALCGRGSSPPSAPCTMYCSSDMGCTLPTHTPSPTPPHPHTHTPTHPHTHTHTHAHPHPHPPAPNYASTGPQTPTYTPTPTPAPRPGCGCLGGWGHWYVGGWAWAGVGRCGCGCGCGRGSSRTCFFFSAIMSSGVSSKL